MKQKILIIDDEIELCELLKDFFRKRGYEVIYALTGQGGVDAFEAETPHIVILDLKLDDIFVHISPLSPCYLNITIQLGNGAEFLLSPNFKRPFIKRISDAFIT